MADYIMRFRIIPGSGTYLNGDVHVTVLGAPDERSAAASGERYLRTSYFSDPQDSFQLSLERIEDAATSQLERGPVVHF